LSSIRGKTYGKRPFHPQSIHKNLEIARNNRRIRESMEKKMTGRSEDPPIIHTVIHTVIHTP